MFTVHEYALVGLVVVVRPVQLVLRLVVDQVVIVLHRRQQVHQQECDEADDHHREQEVEKSFDRKVRRRVNLLDRVRQLKINIKKRNVKNDTWRLWGIQRRIQGMKDELRGC